MPESELEPSAAPTINDDFRKHLQEDVSGNALLVAYKAALTVASETRLEAVLQRLVDLAREVASARYAALGIAREDGRLLQFIHSGMPEEVAKRIGPLPEGHGLLGALIREGRPLLVPDMAKDPRSYGFPPNHPPMRTLLGVPIFLEGRPIGNLYLTERKDGGVFTRGDLAAVEVLAAHAATAVQRAQLFGQIEQARREAEAERDHVQVIIDQLPAGVFIQLPPDGRIEQANAVARQMLLGPGVDRLPDEPIMPTYRQVDGTLIGVHDCPGMIALSGKVVQQQQLLLEGADETVTPVFVQASPLLDAHGEVARAVVVMQDMSRLREAEQLKDDFLSLVSHEFRTPLTAIHGGARLLGSQRQDITEQTEQELIDDIARESGRLDQMLRNMLRLAEMMAGRLKPETEPVLVGPLVAQVVSEVRRQVEDAIWTVDIPTTLPPVEGDPALLQQVLWNLYENALKYSPDEKRVHTTAEVVGNDVIVHVIDHGIGIAPEHVPHVFERFRRPGADPTIRGMGLGLYLCHHLITAQGGRISVSSEGLGRGTTLSISLPIATGWDDARS